MKSFKYWLNEEDYDDTQKSAASSTFTSPNRYMINPDPLAANSALHKRWSDYRQNQVQQGKVAHDLSIFDTYSQIANLIKAIDKNNYRHSRIITMLQKGIRENYDSPTTIMPQPMLNHDLHRLEQDLITAQKQSSANEYAIREVLKRTGIDMHKHLRRSIGFKGMAENITMDYEPTFKTAQNNNQELGLDGPKFFQSLSHLANEISRVSAQTERTKDTINSLYEKTGGIPEPYKPDPESVFD